MTTDNQLESLRREIDRIDDGLHDLLMKRASLVEKIAAAKPEGVALRPGREALILRRLAERHKGPFPMVAMVRIWREIMGALVGLQRPFSVAVYQPDRGAGYIELARNHFGLVWPVAIQSSPGQVVRQVADGLASVGVVPLPGQGSEEQWWLSLTSEAGNLPRIVGKLPFVANDSVSNRAEPLEALVIACRDHEPTGRDRTVLALETAPDVSRDRLRAVLAAAGTEPTAMVATHRDEVVWLHLVEVAGHLTAADGRVAELAAAKDPVLRISVLGGYAEPLAS